MGFVKAWSKTTGQELSVPEHYFEIPALVRGITRDEAEGRDAAKAFTRENVLIPIEEPAKPGFVCHVCGQVLKTAKNLEKHLAKHDEDEQQTPDAGETVDDPTEPAQSADDPKE